MAQLKYFPVFLKYAQTLRSLTAEQLGQVLLAGIQYAENGTLPEMDPAVTVAMGFIRWDIDQAKAAYDETCETNRRNINRRWNRDDDTTVYDGIRSNTTVYDGNQCNVNVSECKEERKESLHSLHAQSDRIEPPGWGPSLQEVRDFVLQNGLNMDADDYYDKRQRAGWRNKNGRYVGSDWQSDVRRWARYQREPVASKAEQSGRPEGSSFDTDEFVDAAVKASYATMEQTKDEPQESAPVEELPEPVVMPSGKRDYSGLWSKIM